MIMKKMLITLATVGAEHGRELDDRPLWVLRPEFQ